MDRHTSSPVLNGAARHFWLASCVCFTRAERMLSWAAMITSFFCNAKVRTDGNSVEGVEVQSIDLGMRLEFKKKGAKPVLSDFVELMANLMAGNLVTQSF